MLTDVFYNAVVQIICKNNLLLSGHTRLVYFPRWRKSGCCLQNTIGRDILDCQFGYLSNINRSIPNCYSPLLSVLKTKQYNCHSRLHYRAEKLHRHPFLGREYFYLESYRQKGRFSEANTYLCLVVLLAVPDPYSSIYQHLKIWHFFCRLSYTGDMLKNSLSEFGLNLRAP